MAADLPPEAARRLFTRDERVRLGDVSPNGRLRLDALVGYLQDVSDDDVRDTGIEGNWVVRRLVIDVTHFPVFGEEITLVTYCSALGSHWAERTVEVHGVRGKSAIATTIWVLVDPKTMAPARLSEAFLSTYGPSAAGRRVRARLEHDDPGAAGTRLPWPWRFVDFDVLDHVNNAAYWTAVEEELARRRDLRAPLHAEIEFRIAIERGDATDLVVVNHKEVLRLWLVSGRGVHASVLVRAA